MAINLKPDDRNEKQTVAVVLFSYNSKPHIAEDVIEELKKFNTELDNLGIGMIITRNNGERANEAVNELVFHLFISIVIIAILLAISLGFKESMIIIFTVPAILAITLFIAYLGDQTINRITLFAFLLSLGL